MHDSVDFAVAAFADDLGILEDPFKPARFETVAFVVANFPLVFIKFYR